MNFLKKAEVYIHHPWSAVDYVTANFLSWLPDRLYLMIRYRARLGNWPELDTPISFNEKINWLKLHYKDVKLCTMVDKYAVKKYVADIIGQEYIIPTLGVWGSPDEIEWDNLPESFVLKTTHGGGGNGIFICTDKSTADKAEALSKMKDGLKKDISSSFREWPYKDVHKRIIAEQYIATDTELNDYKFFCFNGKVRCFKIDFDRFSRHGANYYDEHGHILPFGESDVPPDYEKILKIPENIDEMIGIAEKLSAGMPFLRVDLYNINSRILFGELTLFPASGMGRFTNPEWDVILGSWLKLNRMK